MKLDRNVEGNNGRGKYALVLMRELVHTGELGEIPEEVTSALNTLESHGLLDYGQVNTRAEFFVIRLKDKYAGVALDAYADYASVDDPEYGSEVRALADRSGPNSPFCKLPD
jgi:hypothetical protein